VNPAEELTAAEQAMANATNASPHSDAQARAHLAATTVGDSFVEQAVTPDDSAVSWSGTSTQAPNVTPGNRVGPVAYLSQS
jgi:hypothetical protein